MTDNDDSTTHSTQARRPRGRPPRPARLGVEDACKELLELMPGLKCEPVVREIWAHLATKGILEIVKGIAVSLAFESPKSQGASLRLYAQRLQEKRGGGVFRRAASTKSMGGRPTRRGLRYALNELLSLVHKFGADLAHGERAAALILMLVETNGMSIDAYPSWGIPPELSGPARLAALSERIRKLAEVSAK